MAEDAGAADLIAGGRLQLGISRGSPEQVIDGFRYFGYAPPEGMTDADMARRHTEVFLEVLLGKGFAKPNPNPMFPNPTGLLRLEPYSEGLRERIWWGAGTNATAEWAAKLGMNLQSSTLKIDESGKPFHIQQAEQIRLYRAAWKEAGHTRAPRVSVSRSVFALVDDRDRMYFGGDKSEDQIGMLSEKERAIFGRSYAAEPDALIGQLKQDEAIAEADTLLLTVPNQLGVDYNAHVIEAILKFVAPGLGWREARARSVELRQVGVDDHVRATLGSVSPGMVEIALSPHPAISQQHGFVHAGAVSAIADTAAGYAALTLMPADTGVLTTEFKINLLAPAAGERILARGRVVKAGRTLTLAQAEVFANTGGQEKLIALLTATLMAVKGRDGISD
jgi:uncharacterized protein (TIGR00369 family)